MSEYKEGYDAGHAAGYRLEADAHPCTHPSWDYCAGFYEGYDDGKNLRLQENDHMLPTLP